MGPLILLLQQGQGAGAGSIQDQTGEELPLAQAPPHAHLDGLMPMWSDPQGTVPQGESNEWNVYAPRLFLKKILECINAYVTLTCIYYF